MSVDTILISRGPGETRVALLSEGRLVELLVSRPGQEGVAGNIYLGRVEAALKGLDAAFVDIGLERPGFLALPEARPAGAQAEPADSIGDYLAEGDAQLVQVLRDPVEDKGAKLTTHINLPGVNLVFRPDHPGVNVSRRIEDEAERDRLTAMVEGLAPEGGGFIVRTAAAGAEDGALEQEAQGLVTRWAAIRHRRANAKAPSALHTEPGPALRALRDFGGGVGKIVADDAGVLNEIKEFCQTGMPDLAALAEAHKGSDDLFEASGVEEQIDEALTPGVGLTGGGTLIVSQTPALTAIDVNTAGAGAGGSKEQTALDVNLEAAAEAARQIRLRNISGLIVIDFVPVRDEGNKRTVLDALRRAAAGDPQGPHVVGYTRMGLVEMTRRRHGPSLAEVLGPAGSGGLGGPGGPGPVKSPLTLALTALRAVLRAAPSRRPGAGADVTLRLPVDVAGTLNAPLNAPLNSPGGPEALKEAEERLGLAIKVTADQTLVDGQFEVE